MERLRHKYLLPLRKGEPITYRGFAIFPLTLESIYEYESCRGALAVGTDNAYSHLPYLTMLYEIGRGGGGYDLFFSALRLLTLALRAQGEMSDARVGMDERKQIFVLFPGMEAVTESVFREMRVIIALQNAIELPDDGENPQLRNGAALEQKLKGQSYAQRVDDLLDWFCYKHRMTSAALFASGYTIKDFIGQCEAAGTEKWFTITHGYGYAFKDAPHPYPHFAYRREAQPYNIQAVEGFDPIGETSETAKEKMGLT